MWQEIAENFYPERANFTLRQDLGDEYASWLETSYPLLARRDLGNQIGGMLRPTSKEWFKIIRKYDDGTLDLDGRAFLEWMTKMLRRAMYDPVAQLTRATKEGDHDWATFGQNVISIKLNPRVNSLWYKCWHLKDCAWQEDETGKIGTVYRKWQPTAFMISRLFNDIHPKVKEALVKDPYKRFNVWHCELPYDIYPESEKNRGDLPLVSAFYDVDNKHLMEEVAVPESEYIIPRWQTQSDTQYAFSPAVIAALPDARLIQSMAATLLDAGERSVAPPMIAVGEAIRGDISVYAGGITWVDAEYDERLGEVMREMPQGGDLPAGFKMSEETKINIMEAFYLNKLALPPAEREMTAYEVGQRVMEYIRQALPLFEPMEIEYNGALCEKSLSVMMRNGAFGDPSRMPKSLRGGDVVFQFESPLREATERAKGQRFLESKEMIATAVELDPSARFVMNTTTALRDVLEGIGIPAKWTRKELESDAMEESEMQSMKAQELLAQAQAGADVAKTASEAGLDVTGA
jgi:hypothetical protein